MADTNPRQHADIAATATSLTHISQEAMLEIIGMKPVRSDNIAHANEDTTDITNKEEVLAPEIKVENSDGEKVSTEPSGDADKGDERKEIVVKIAKSEKERVKSRCSTPAPGKEDASAADGSGKTCKELKSILQLSKEARLDTNIGHKRKSIDVSKTNERLEQSEKDSSEERELDMSSWFVRVQQKISRGRARTVRREQDGVKSDLENMKPELKVKPIQIRIKLNPKYLTDYDCATCIAAKGKVKKTNDDGDKQASTLQRKDSFCWRCHKAEINISCEVCPRSYHIKCVKQNVPADLENWLCPECVITLKSENTSTRSTAMKDMTVEHLCSLLKFALKRMIKCTTTDPFTTPVNKRDFPDYSKYIIQPMDLTHLGKHIKENIYGSPQAFEADAKWILHNSIIYNGYQSKLTTAAKSIIKVCKQEMQEIENCSTCYLNANVKKNSWFVEVCPKPHILLWAKLKSFPYWPAKAMGTNSQGMVDARFFGAHDRAWVPIKDCYLFSRKDPNSSNVQKNNINECIKELEVHAAKLKEIYGEFNYAPYKTPYDPELEVEQLKIFLPKYKPNLQQRTVVSKIKNTTVINGKSPSSESTSSSSSSYISTSSGNSNRSSDHKKRARSRSRHRKSTPAFEEDRDMEGYGTDDDFDNSLNNEKRKEFLKTFQDDEEQQQGEGRAEREKRRSISVLGKEIDGESGWGSSTGQSENKTGVQDASPAQSKLPKDTIEPPSKRPKKSPEKTNDDTSRQSNISDKINKVNIAENMEITLGNASSSAVSSDSSNDTVNCVVKTKNAIQVDVENKELTISPQNKTKISDKIIRILNNAEEAASSSTDQNKEMTQTDLLLKKYTSQKESVAEPQVAESRSGDGGKNLLEDTQVDEANINSMILNQKSVEKGAVTIIRKGKKRSVGSTESNESSQSKTLKLTEHQQHLRHNVIINEANNVGNRDTPENNFNETDPLALVEVKTEPCSDDEMLPVIPGTTTQTRKTNEPSKAIDNLTRVIDAVAVGTSTVNTILKTSISASPKPPPPLPPPPTPVRKTYNKARKSFPIAKTFETPPPVTTTVTFALQPQQILTQAPPLVRIGVDNLTPPLNLLPLKTTVAQIELKESQNYIPLPQIPSPASVRATDIPQINATATTTVATSSQPANGTATNACLSGIMDEFRALSSALPEVASKAVSELICKPPPKLKPRPPSALREGFEECIASSAGHVTSKLNSMAYRMSDYFRGLITETLQDMSTEFGDNAATVAVLKAEIEQLKHNHSLEILEIKKNVYSILKDIQKSILEDQRKLMEDTRASCEAETVRRIHETKTKTWCAQCFKEAQFYCCWNTSYCDYACQQRHWPKHANKCAQNAANATSSQAATVSRPPQVQPVVLRPAPTIKSMNNKPLLPKPPTTTKVMINARAANLTNQIAQIMKSTTASHIRLVESTPGNFEIMGDPPMKVNRKLITNTSAVGKFKSGNIITVTSPSTSGMLMSTSQNNSVNTVNTSTAMSFDLPTISNVMSLADQSI